MFFLGWGFFVSGLSFNFMNHSNVSATLETRKTVFPLKIAGTSMANTTIPVTGALYSSRIFPQ